MTVPLKEMANCPPGSTLIPSSLGKLVHIPHVSINKKRQVPLFLIIPGSPSLMVIQWGNRKNMQVISLLKHTVEKSTAAQRLIKCSVNLALSNTERKKLTDGQNIHALNHVVGGQDPNFGGRHLCSSWAPKRKIHQQGTVHYLERGCTDRREIGWGKEICWWNMAVRRHCSTILPNSHWFQTHSGLFDPFTLHWG